MLLPYRLMDKKRRFSQIVQDIKSVKIQGARNVALASLKAYSLNPNPKSKKILLTSRPTEPMMTHVLALVPKTPREKILEHFSYAQDGINKNILKIIKNRDIIFTHCHSTNVSNSLIYSKKKGKKFQVYNTETRPLYQGRKTAKELSRAGIKVTMFVDSAAAIAIEKQDNKDKMHADLVLLGADAITKKGVINKIGSGLISEIASSHKVPVYIVADSWKYSSKPVPIEQRSLNEVWDKAPKNVKVKNPAFEFVPKKYIKAIVSEFGVLKYDDFLKKVSKNS